LLLVKAMNFEQTLRKVVREELERVLGLHGQVPVAGKVPGYLRQPEVLASVRFSSATLWRKVKDGTFPAPVKLSERITAWRADDVRGWLDQQKRGRDNIP
jgi:prophage regulatory protein